MASFVRAVPNRTLLRCMDLTDGRVRRPRNLPSSSLYRRVLTDTVTNQKFFWKNAREKGLHIE
jgi:hypothetical protein